MTPIKLHAILMRPEARPNYVLAAKIGVAPSRLSEWALGKRPIPPERLLRLCELLNVAPDEVLGDLEPVLGSNNGTSS